MAVRRWIPIAMLVAVCISLLVPLSARADGVIIVDPPQCDPACPGPTYIGDQLVVRSHKVDVTIDNQLATTKIDQVFFNPNDWVAEGTYIFPIPEGATVDKFTMTIDGQVVEAKILSADEARATYEEIVRSMRDPALLEYLGRGAIQASIFPIGPGEERQVEISYQEVLTADQGLVRYVYPLNTEQFSAQPLESASIHVSIASASPLRAIYSPTHPIATNRSDDLHATVGWEASNVLPSDDFELLYTTSDQGIGVNVISHFDAASNQGTFLLLAAPGIDAAQSAIAKDVVVVLDTSGSMEGEKLAQAKAALASILNRLNREDRFTIIEFSTGVRTYASELQPTSAATDAIAWVNRLESSGGTDINGALTQAMTYVDNSRPTYILFLTDGLPTEGVTDIPSILTNVDAAAPDDIRLFSFGVGDDVDTTLLDTLSQEHHGATAYVRPGEELDSAVSELYGKISAPVLTDVTLAISGAETEELYPQPMPDLFAGSQTVIAGHYKAGGPITIVLSGKVNGEQQSFTYEGQSLTTGPGAEGLPRLWASRKIGYLMTQIRLHGENQEWIQAIVDLSVKYGIVTPYTSYLITEDDILTSEGRAGAAQRAEATVSAAPSTGAAAVDQSQSEMSLSGGSDGSSAGNAGVSDEYAGQVTVIGSRAFVNQHGVWIETTFDPSTMTTVKVEFGSDDYFALLAEHPELAGAFALGEQVIAFAADGTAYEVTAAAQAS